MTKLAALGAVVVMTVAGRAGAQARALPVAGAGSNECLAAIPDSELTRVPVFATVEMLDGLRHEVPPDLANTLQAVADRARAFVSAGTDTLPRGEPALSWRDLDGSIRGVWHRDGRLTSSIAGDSSAGIRLLARALGVAQAEGDASMIWPDTVRADSLVFYLSLVRPAIDSTGAIEAVAQRPLVSVFSLAAPRQRSARFLSGDPGRYPHRALSDGVTGTVVVQYVVDTTGRADMTTVRDVWPDDRPRPRGMLATDYDDILASGRIVIEKSRFTPARIGRCRVRQVVRNSFTIESGQ